MDNSIRHKIAVVGLGALFPDAKNVREYWQNIRTKKVSIRPLPEELFESEIYYRPDLLTAINKQDKSTTNIAAWIENLDFDTVRKYKIPPSVTEHMDPNQHAALYATDEALQNKSLDNIPKDRVAVVLGNGMVGTSYGNGLARVQFDLIEHYLRKHDGFRKLLILP
jgi:acyl transferase domain-containing protein